MLKCYKIIEIFLYSVGVIPYAFLKLRENISWYHHRKRGNVDGNGRLVVPESRQPERKIPSELVPHCPKCGKPMSMNLRADGTFIQDEGWYAASNRYYEFLKRHENLFILFLELGVGENTPAIIKYPFWRMTAENPKAVYACINWGQAYAPKEISERSICIDQDIGEVLGKIIKDNV